MGLDVTAYRQVRKVADWPEGVESIDEIAEYEGLSNGYIWNGMRVTNVHPAQKDHPLHRAMLTPGVRAYVDRERMRAGSYSGYNEWRNWLAIARYGLTAREVWTRWEADPGFREGAAWLINFSDCEGYIDASIAARILADLQAHAQAIIASAPEGWYADKFRGWLGLLEIATDGGLLDFS
jgi:hypothetical protein